MPERSAEHRFGEFELDLGRGELRRGGAVLPLRPKPFALLACLIEHRDRAVGKDELLDRLWPGVVVSESALTSALRDVRRALGDSGRGQRWIRTLRGHGLRFVAELENAPARPQGGSPFVGRAATLARLGEALEAATAGAGRVLLLAGEAGIGKTRTAQELAGLARDRGFAVRESWCPDDPAAPAYWPWIQLVRGIAGERGAEALRAALGEGAVDVARIAPELHQALPGLPRLDADPPPDLHFRLMDALARLLAESARMRPLLWVIDDLHWADAYSLRALAFAARDIPAGSLVVAGTLRPEEIAGRPDLADPLADLERLSGGARIALEGLSREEVAQLAAHTSDALPAEQIWERSGGNPLFAQELIEHLGGRDPQERSAGLSEVPPAVEALIGRRARKLSERAQEAVAIASLLGTPADPRLVAATARVEPLEVLAAFEEAEREGLLRRAGDGAGTHAFAHDLTRDAVRSQLAVSRQQALHARIADVLAGADPTAPRALYGAASHALAAARAGGDAQRALELARRAVDAAAAELAWEEEARQIDHALAAAHLADLLEHGDRCDLLLRLADAQARAGSLGSARAAARRAAEVARRLGDSARLGRAAEAFVIDPHWGTRDAASLALLEEAVEAMESRDSPLRLRLLASLAWHLRAAGEVQRSRELVQEAYEGAERLGDPVVLAFVLRVLLSDDWVETRQDIEAKLATADRILDLARGTRMPTFAAEAALHKINLLLVRGDLAAADRALASLAAQIEAGRLLRYAWVIPAYRGCRAYLAGRWADAERLAGEAHDLCSPAERGTAEGCRASILYRIRFDQGRLGEVGADAIQLENPSANPDADLRFHLARTQILAETGRTAEAHSVFEQLMEQELPEFLSEGSPRVGEPELLFQLGEVCAELEVAGHAPLPYERLLPFSGRHLVVFVHVVWGPFSGVLGRLATLMGRYDEAEAHFASARASVEAMPAPPLLARVRLDHAQMLLLRDAEGDRARARELLDAALATAEALGMARLRERASELRVDTRTRARGAGALHG